MKSLNQYIEEKLVINRNSKVKEHNYHPKTKDELKSEQKVCTFNLNDLDTKYYH